MAKPKEPFNPFYPVLVAAGIVFLITACAYGVMAFRDVRAAASMETTPNALMLLMQDHGGKLLGGELVVLALSSFAAMGVDQYRSRDAAREFRANRLAAAHTSHSDLQPTVAEATSAASASASAASPDSA
jgi:hypothetical protein